jgi:hypothetical protein
LIAAVIGYALLAEKFGVIFVVCAWIFVFMIWMMFLMDTYCDYDLGDRGCSRPVYGKLRGCWQHARLKRDAVWAALGRHNPGTLIRLTWSNRAPEPGRRVGDRAGSSRLPRAEPGAAQPSEAAAQQGFYGLSMWAFTAVSAVAAVAALFWP